MSLQNNAAMPKVKSTHCNICSLELKEPVYQGEPKNSLTSINTQSTQATIVWFCPQCAHTMTSPLEDIAAFYGEDYSLGIQSEDEDQLIKVENGKPVYRTDYQKETLFGKIALPEGAFIVDFGSGKAGTLKKILSDRDDLQGHAFDVSDHYIPFWQKFLPEKHYAVSEIPLSWIGKADLSMSFFMLEHVADPLAILRTQHALLKENGTIYFVIPFLCKNPADMLVADHINHFSLPSMRWALEATGFTDIDMDTEINPQWLVVTAKKTTASSPVKISTPDIKEKQQCETISREIAAYWQLMGKQVQNFLEEVPEQEKIAIYGAGFYGTFIWEHLPAHQQVACFIDRNQHLHGRQHKGRNILPPEQLPKEVTHILVGINPQVAESAIKEVKSWQDKSLTYHFLF